MTPKPSLSRPFSLWIAPPFVVLFLSGCNAFAPSAHTPPTRHVKLTDVHQSPGSAGDSLHLATPSSLDGHHFFPLSRRGVILSLQGEDDGDSSGLSTPLDRPVLAAVDLMSLLIFAAVGKASHNPDGSYDFGAILVTALPFVSSWFLTSPLTGVYSEDSKDGNMVAEAVVKTAKGWVLAIPLGCVLRGVIKGYVPPTSFVIVTLIATLVILGGARVFFAFAEDFFVELVN